MNCTRKSEIKEIFFEDRREIDPKIIAERLNNYYVKSVEDIVNTIQPGKEITPVINSTGKFLEKFEQISLSLRDKIFHLKSNNNPNEILNQKVMKEVFDVIRSKFYKFVSKKR